MILTLALMVKDEAGIVLRCLDSAARAGVSRAVVLDTGSTDGTQDIIRSADLPVTLHEEPFVDFGTSRSRLLELARGQGDWLLDMDADQTVEISDPDWQPDSAVDAYMIESGDDRLAYRLPKLLRADLSWRSFGVTHEYTALADGRLGNRQPTDALRIVHHVDGASRAGKFTRDRLLLESAVADDPSDSRSTYYLAQTLRDIGQRDEARRLYTRRAGMGGWEEERWHAAYQAALLTAPWPDRLAALLAAYDARPWRPEPLRHAASEARSLGLARLADMLAWMASQADGRDDILFREAA